jgi:hypothetical protein
VACLSAAFTTLHHGGDAARRKIATGYGLYGALQNLDVLVKKRTRD